MDGKKKPLPWGTIIPSTLFSIVLVAIALSFSGYTIFGAVGWIFNGSGEKKSGFSDPGNSPSLGRPDAPVTIVVFADFQCPTCTIFHFGAQEAIIDAYVRKGLARLIFKHYPILGDESFFAAYASECAREQGKFWEYGNALFEKRAQSDAENSGMFSRTNLLYIGERIGLQKTMFEQCLASERYVENVTHDLEEGNAGGVQGTPTVFINNEKFEGSLSFDAYKAAIEKIAVK